MRRALRWIVTPLRWFWRKLVEADLAAEYPALPRSLSDLAERHRINDIERQRVKRQLRRAVERGL